MYRAGKIHNAAMNMLLYNIAFAGALMCLILGFYVIAQNRRSVQRRIFLLICVSLSILNLVALPAYSADTKEGVFFWTQFASICVNIFYALNLHFYLNLLKKKTPVRALMLIYAPALVIIAMYALHPLLFLDYKPYEGGWKLVPNYGSPWFYASAGYVVLYAFLSIAAIIAFRKNATSNKEKLQANLIMANLALSTCIGVLGLWVLPYFNYKIPNVGPTYHIVYVLGLFYSVFYLKFLDLKPSIVADEIISNISDMVLLLGPDLRVLSANAVLLETLSLGADEISRKKYPELVYDGDGILADMDRVRNREAGSVRRALRYRINRNKKAEPIMTDTYISKVADRFDDIIGFLVISKINRGRRQFQLAYKLTDRELEIADLTLAGLSSREIGARLGISDRTVQSHQEHVYQKLGAEGKVDLIRIAHGFNIASIE